MKPTTRACRGALPAALIILMVLASGAGSRAANGPQDAGGDSFKLGLAQWGQGDLDAAIVSFTAAVRMRPGEAQPLVARGLVYLDKSNLDEAVADFTLVLQQSKDNFRTCGAGPHLLRARPVGQSRG